MEPSVENPLYEKVMHDDQSATKYYFITVDEGWRTSIVCEKIYVWAADWLIEQLQGKPYCPESRS